MNTLYYCYFYIDCSMVLKIKMLEKTFVVEK